MRPIKVGDIVTVCMARGECFDFQIYPQISRVTVLHVPEATGALWYFRAGGENGVEFAVNPCAADFVGLILEVEERCPTPTRWRDWPGCFAVRTIGG